MLAPFAILDGGSHLMEISWWPRLTILGGDKRAGMVVPWIVAVFLSLTFGGCLISSFSGVTNNLYVSASFRFRMKAS